ncbi:Rps23 Pro-64 3,4-dihydroxylase Tpa1-like proline 4-hydroxylase [Rheinheimera pacifica]|uniref:2OG-Fe(II) oxygenase n=1 Tax=Rheinheimera pacifica TaxID=173990 RepID=UPI002167968C|nr:2OG-Fe(II) oxygenase [Rheinheimera pacifica]MCS4307743.1 Rps23 Pro-64 3,4-dihydroxylase Tpa1-like proline 4-hydroxylase [Rheinheimera pacifica]
MWLNEEQKLDAAIRTYRKTLLQSTPQHIVIDNLFDSNKLDEVVSILQQESGWQTQKHTYSALYVDNAKWQKTQKKQRFVQRDLWQRPALSAVGAPDNVAEQFLAFLRSDEFMSWLSRIFKVALTDINVANPAINSNCFRLGATDFVNQHADDSPGREVCMLLYLNKGWQHNNGGELVFLGADANPVSIAPLYNRCVLFNPASPGSEHWVKALTTENTQQYRYNVTSWYWSE